MSQEKLGEALNLTFQQVQKYEKGTNRIGASRLQQISETLKVPPAYFFEGTPSEGSGGPGAARTGMAEDRSTYVVDFLSTTEGLLLNRAFTRIRDAKVRRRLVALITALADIAEDTPASDS